MWRAARCQKARLCEIRRSTEGGAGGQAVDEILKHQVTDVVAGGMGAQNKFAAAGVNVFGFSGTAGEGIRAVLDKAAGGLGACNGHEDCG